LFNGFYEVGGEFEPIIAFLLKSRQLVFQKLFLIDELVFGFSGIRRGLRRFQNRRSSIFPA